MSVDRLLQEQGVKVKRTTWWESTSPTSMLKNHDVVNVQSAYQTTITIDGQEVPFWTVASSAEQLLDFFNQKRNRSGENHRQYQQRLQQAHRRSHHQPEGARHRHRGRKSSVAPNGKLPAASILDAKGITLGKGGSRQCRKKGRQDDHSARPPRDAW